MTRTLYLVLCRCWLGPLSPPASLPPLSILPTALDLRLAKCLIIIINVILTSLRLGTRPELISIRIKIMHRLHPLLLPREQVRESPGGLQSSCCQSVDIILILLVLHLISQPSPPVFMIQSSGEERREDQQLASFLFSQCVLSHPPYQAENGR